MIASAFHDKPFALPKQEKTLLFQRKEAFLMQIVPYLESRVLSDPNWVPETSSNLWRRSWMVSFVFS